MTDADPLERMARSGSGKKPSRRAILGGIAATGALAGVPAGVLGAEEDDGAEMEDDEAEGAEDDAGDAEDDANGAEGELETVVEFEPPALPENIAIDDEGTVYLSMGPSGEVRAVEEDGSDTTVATVDTGEEGLLLGITVLDGTLYAANNSGESETHGVWRVEPEGDGEPERIAELPAEETAPNGIIPDPTSSDALLVSDHLGGAIWRVTTDGETEEWVSDSSLEPDMEAEIPVGVDGLAVHPDGDVYTDNLNEGTVIRVPVEDDGAGDPETVVQDEGLVGADGLTVDEEGDVYVAVNMENEIVRVTPEEEEFETIVSGEGLDFPADVHFGTTEEEATSLYIANFAFGTFQEDEEAAEPSLAKTDVGVRGFFPEDADADEADGDDAAEDEEDDAAEDEEDAAAEEDGAAAEEDETPAEEEDETPAEDETDGGEDETPADGDEPPEDENGAPGEDGEATDDEEGGGMDED